MKSTTISLRKKARHPLGLQPWLAGSFIALVLQQGFFRLLARLAQRSPAQWCHCLSHRCPRLRWKHLAKARRPPRQLLSKRPVVFLSVLGSPYMRLEDVQFAALTQATGAAQAVTTVAQAALRQASWEAGEGWQAGARHALARYSSAWETGE